MGTETRETNAGTGNQGHFAVDPSPKSSISRAGLDQVYLGQ